MSLHKFLSMKWRNPGSAFIIDWIWIRCPLSCKCIFFHSGSRRYWQDHFIWSSLQSSLVRRWNCFVFCFLKHCSWVDISWSSRSFKIWYSVQLEGTSVVKITAHSEVNQLLRATDFICDEILMQLRRCLEHVHSLLCYSRSSDPLFLSGLPNAIGTRTYHLFPCDPDD